ncbi:hypothetical protein BU23DRAFT_251084 [Bimuria novae-zelandiae CBS 107.79]|uniref:Uncharacterized protein n=1 Tax=Bimuria novae-zelandiae CBS 107.79 TaxID=1447943 RepID=A0A6A5VND2_9PLEO|nr:hypothetical protein BU23DRAFT_251084 [Bimuria novae-zelandiae CBS 107.79]
MLHCPGWASLNVVVFQIVRSVMPLLRRQYLRLCLCSCRVPIPRFSRHVFGVGTNGVASWQTALRTMTRFDRVGALPTFSACIPACGSVITVDDRGRVRSSRCSACETACKGVYLLPSIRVGVTEGTYALLYAVSLAVHKRLSKEDSGCSERACMPLDAVQVYPRRAAADPGVCARLRAVSSAVCKELFKKDSERLVRARVCHQELP